MTAPYPGVTTRRLASGATLYRYEVSTAREEEIAEIAACAAKHGISIPALTRQAVLAFVRGVEPAVSVPLSAVSRGALEEEVRRRAAKEDGA